MVYNPATDFLGLWRNNAGAVSKLEMPGVDYVVAALARAGLITLAVSATPPVANQSTTAWLQTAVPSTSAEGTLRLWNGTTYVAATQALLFDMLQISAGQSGVSWWTTAGGPPINTVGNNGDYAIRTDTPGGVYGPKTAGAWPANPLPGTTNTIASSALDNTFGTTEGSLIYRDAALWQSLLPPGAANELLIFNGTKPAWILLSALLDGVFGTAQGSVLYRGATAWAGLGPGTNNQVFTTQGPGANPIWSNKSSEFTSGTVLVFYQAAAPAGWTKQVAVNDAGLRVVSGAGGVFSAGSAFSTVFSQTAVGNTTITTATMPSHAHSGAVTGTNAYNSPGGATNVIQSLVIGATSTVGSDGAHTHAVTLNLAYADVIICSKN